MRKHAIREKPRVIESSERTDISRSFEAFFPCQQSPPVVVIIIRFNLLINLFLMKASRRGPTRRDTNWFFPRCSLSSMNGELFSLRWQTSNRCPWKQESSLRALFLCASAEHFFHHSNCFTIGKLSFFFVSIVIRHCEHVEVNQRTLSAKSEHSAIIRQIKLSSDVRGNKKRFY